MLISGYLFFSSCQKYNFEVLISKKVYNLFRPIIIGGVFEYILTTTLFGFLRGQGLSVLLDGKWFINKLTSLWFLWSALSATIVMCFVKKAEDNAILKCVIILLGIFLVALFPNHNMYIYMYPFFVLGYYYAKYKEKLIRFDKLKYLSIILFPLLMMLYEKKHFIYISGIIGGSSIAESIFIDVYRWLIGFVGCIFTITLIQMLISVHVSCNVMRKFIPLGKKSLQVYVVSVVFLSTYLPIIMTLIRKIGILETLYQTITSNILIYDCTFMLLLAIIYAIVLYLIVYFMDKIKLSKIIFGR